MLLFKITTKKLLDMNQKHLILEAKLCLLKYQCLPTEFILAPTRGHARGPWREGVVHIQTDDVDVVG